MARDMEMDMLIKPIVDTKAFDAGLKRLQSMAQKGVSGLSSKESARFEALASRLIGSLIVSGRATTATQGRMQIQSALGKISGSTAAILRGSQNIAEMAVSRGRIMPYGSFSERQIKSWRADLAGTAGAYNTMLNSYASFKSSPSSQTQSELLKAVVAVNTQLSSISKDRKAEIKTFGRIEKDTQAIHKEATQWHTPLTPSRTTGMAGVYDFFKTGGKYLLSILGIGSILGGIKKLIGLGLEGIKEGHNDLIEQAMYGTSRNIAIGRSRAKMYGLDESVTAAPERYALDFRQRMMYGEVSDKEWIALSRMGGLGRMIISGQAARNPEAFQQALQNYISNNRGNEAEVRQTLKWLGLSPQIMGYGAIPVSDEQTQELESAYAENIKSQKDAAVLFWATATEFRKIIDEIKADTAGSISRLGNTPESRFRQAVAWRGGGYSARERQMVEEALRERTALETAVLNGNNSYVAEKLHMSPNAAALLVSHPEVRESVGRGDTALDYYRNLDINVHVYDDRTETNVNGTRSWSSMDNTRSAQ